MRLNPLLYIYIYRNSWSLDPGSISHMKGCWFTLCAATFAPLHPSTPQMTALWPKVPSLGETPTHAEVQQKVLALKPCFFGGLLSKYIRAIFLLTFFFGKNNAEHRFVIDI